MPATTSRAKAKPNYGSKWASQLSDLDLPSGEIAQVRRPGMQGLIKAGVLHSMDSLTGLVQSEVIPKAEGRPIVSSEDVMQDPEKLEAMLDQVDKIVLYVVVQPPLVKPVRMNTDENGDLILDRFKKPTPMLDAEGKEIFLPFDEREAEVVYLDYVELEDKMFIMNFALGGTRDLEDFRKKSEEAMGSIPNGEAAADPTV
jgi:hypothetical protein